MKFPLNMLIATVALVSGGVHATAQSQLDNYDFQIIERDPEAISDATRYFGRLTVGTERKNNSLNRLTILAEDQLDYPIPQSGCGPTAMLNILVWYEKYGLIESFNRQSDPAKYKIQLFKEIDRRITEKSGIARTDTKGTNTMDAAIVMDDIVKLRSGGQTRVHSDYTKAPLKLKDFLGAMPNFRAGYLIVEPKDAQTGKLRNAHAATLIRADRAGYVTLSTWGKVYRGLLRTRSDGQWFVPQDPEHLELKIVGMMRFIPFRPTAPAGR